MKKNRPKFCVGEPVAIDSVLRPDLNCQSTEVIAVAYHKGTVVNKIPYEGWVYQVASNNRKWCEPALRKLPPDPERSFKSLMEKITDKETEDCVS